MFRRFGSGAASFGVSSPGSSLYSCLSISLSLSSSSSAPVPTGWGHIVLGLRGPVCTKTQKTQTQIW